jgi:hypothetical protein
MSGRLAGHGLMPIAPGRIVERAKMSLHDRFGWHLPDHPNGHWDAGEYVSTCTICAQPMVKTIGEPWRLRPKG